MTNRPQSQHPIAFIERVPCVHQQETPLFLVRAFLPKKLGDASAAFDASYEFFQKEGSAEDVRLESSIGRVGEEIVVL